MAMNRNMMRQMQQLQSKLEKAQERTRGHGQWRAAQAAAQ